MCLKQWKYGKGDIPPASGQKEEKWRLRLVWTDMRSRSTFTSIGGSYKNRVGRKRCHSEGQCYMRLRMTQVFREVKVGKIWQKYLFRFPNNKKSSSWICEELCYLFLEELTWVEEKVYELWAQSPLRASVTMLTCIAFRSCRALPFLCLEAYSFLLLWCVLLKAELIGKRLSVTNFASLV